MNKVKKRGIIPDRRNMITQTVTENALLQWQCCASTRMTQLKWQDTRVNTFTCYEKVLLLSLALTTLFATWVQLWEGKIRLVKIQ